MIPPEITATKPYKILVLLNTQPASLAALGQAVRLCQSLKVDHKLLLAYVCAKNPQAMLPGLGSLEKAYNMDIETEAEQEVESLKQVVAQWQGKLNYEFVEVLGEGDVGPLIEDFIKESHPDIDMLIVGSRGLGPLKRWALGSVSDYCIHHLNIPVMVIKGEPEHNLEAVEAGEQSTTSVAANTKRD